MRQLAALEHTLERIHDVLSVRRNDLTTRQIRAFLMIAKASIEGDPITTEDLRRVLNLSSQTAHNTVSYFVDQGFIERRVSTEDCRAKLLYLTETGKQIAEFLAGVKPQLQEERSARITSGIEQLVSSSGS